MIKNTKITKKEIAKAITRSGYLLEQRIENILKNQGYLVTANDSYLDPYTDKSREIDISAMTAKKLSKDYDFIFPRLICECENNSQPVVFFVNDPQMPFMHHYEVKVAGLPSQCLATNKKFKKGFISLSKFLNFEKHHHYCKGLIATQYCSFIQKKGTNEWMASHLEEQHDSLTNLIVALEFYIDKYYEDYVVAKRNENENINLEFFYPLLILQGPLFSAQIKQNKLLIKPTKHLQFRKEFYVKNQHVTYQIDIIHESFFKKYLKIIDSEMNRAATVIKRRKKLVKHSIELLVDKARGKKKSQTYREIFEF